MNGLQTEVLVRGSLVNAGMRASGRTPGPGQTPVPVEAGWNLLLAPQQELGEVGRLGRYSVKRLLGAGGAGFAFLAVAPDSPAPVCLKILRPEIAFNPLSRARFFRESEVLRQVSHPNVVRLIESGEANVPGLRFPVPFLVTEFVAGESLQDHLDQQGPVPREELLRWAEQLTLGLQAIHAAGLIHRDLKPGNVVIDQTTKQAKILDFGLARSTQRENIFTAEHVLSGTPEYMSPEQLRGVDLDARSDLFSLGTLLYALASGQSPFQTQSVLELQSRLLYGHVLGLLTVRPDLPPAFCALVDHLLEKEPRARPDSAQAVLRTLTCGDVKERAPTAPVAKRPESLPHLLLADDDPAFVAATKHWLVRRGYTVCVAANREEALSRLNDNTKLLLLDLELGTDDGLALLPEIKQRNPELPIIILTAHGSIERAVKATKLGSDDFLTKPAKLDELYSVVGRHFLPA